MNMHVDKVNAVDNAMRPSAAPRENNTHKKSPGNKGRVSGAEHVPNDVHPGYPAQGGGAGLDDIQYRPRRL
jgi:hypothetical protein